MKSQHTSAASKGAAHATGKKRKVCEWGWLTGFDLQQAWGIGSKPANPGIPAKRATKRFAAPHA